MINWIIDNYKRIFTNIFMFFSYFIYEILFIYLLYRFRINYYEFSFSKKVLTIFIMNLIYQVFLIIVYRKELKKDLIDFKKNFKKYIKSNFSLYILGVLLMGFSNYIIQNFTGSTISGNESSIRKLIETAPIYMIYSTIIYAPIVEEIIFRKSVKNVFNNKYLFIIISGVIFGVLHISDFYNINEILLGIPYIIMGLDLAYIYLRTNNIYTTILFHSVHNFILLLIQFIL